RILELANKAHSLYVTQSPAEKAKLLRMVLSNCFVDAVSVYPTYRKPFDMIFERAKTKEWWAWVDLNHRPRPYQSSLIWFYNNLQDRGDCQNTRKSHKSSHVVGWIVG
ncbi:MAG: hypothetical protein ABSH39_20375, partial [Candidatus Acidiferrum sp.]